MSLHSNQMAAPDITVPVAEPSSQEFENFIYLVSHDVRNSVRALLEVPQWIEEDLADSGIDIAGPLADNIELMNVHTRRLDRMLIDLLVYSRIGRMQSKGEVLWDTVVDSIIDQIQVPNGFRIIRDICAPEIHMGENDVMTLMSSLISNSIKHNDAKHGILKISTRNLRNAVELTVTDNGPGIPPRFREKVFQVMTTLRPRDEVEGSGMGMANVRKIANHYNATIEWFTPETERGLALRFLFPKS